MADFDKLRQELEQFKKINANELEFRPIEKWMVGKLGVERLPSKGGSHVYFKHQILEQWNRTGHFQVSLKKGSKKAIIYRKNFLEYLYKSLKLIIDLLEQEAASEE